MDIDVVRKDAAAADTVARIHALLDSLGFHRDRALVYWWSAGADCHSCHVRFANYPLIFANGKGVTPELAYASALAEFIERLQCRADSFFTRAGNIHRLPPFAPGRNRTMDEIAAAVPRLASNDLGGLAGGGPGVESCLEFADVFGARVVDLPFDTLCLMTGTTGMCAGNTPEEAIAHGICEVFERHAIRSVADGLVEGLPSIPLDTLPLGSPVVRRQLETLASSGIDVLVKDATLGGAFPVLAVVLSDQAAGTCHVSFGSDPVFDVALSRCITEAFQGSNALFRLLPTEDRRARALDIYNNTEVLADRLTPDVGRPCIEGGFADVRTNREALRFAVERVSRAGLGLYVRDCSLFGFPAYYVYVERLSALKSLRPADVSHLFAHVESVRTTILRLPHASRQEVAWAAGVMFDELAEGNPALEESLLPAVLQAPAISPLGMRPLLVLMLLEAGRLDDARATLARPRQAPPGLAPPVTVDDVAAWLPGYATTRGDAVAASALRDRFERAFGPGSAHAADRASGQATPLPLPRCLGVYSCASCPCRRSCGLDDWYILARRLRAGVVELRQEQVLDGIRTSC